MNLLKILLTLLLLGIVFWPLIAKANTVTNNAQSVTITPEGIKLGTITCINDTVCSQTPKLVTVTVVSSPYSIEKTQADQLATEKEKARQKADLTVKQKTAVTPSSVLAGNSPPDNLGVSGGSSTLPPIFTKIISCESGGNPTSQNKRSTASGLFQFVDGTWNNYGGYKHAKDAPVAVQEARALLEYQSSGLRAWSSSSSCWN